MMMRILVQMDDLLLHWAVERDHPCQDQSVGVQGVALVEVFPLYVIIRAGSSDDW